MTYFDELAYAMNTLSLQADTMFVGQGVGCNGTAMSKSFVGVPADKRVEFPVAEDMQMGYCTGLAMQGFLPVCIFPRWNFLLCAANQLVNHLDRLPLYTDGGFKPKVIIRVAAPSTAPFNPGPQHDDDFSNAFANMLRTIRVVRLMEASRILPEYRAARDREHSTILVEYPALYEQEAV